ncbi:MAG: Na+/H+ antiporter subunit D [Candidatus Hydrogenedentota bacterium]
MATIPIEHAVLALIVLPLAAAILSIFAGKRGPTLALGAAAIQAAAACRIAMGLNQNGAIRYRISGWGAPLGIDLHLDGLSTIMLFLSTLVGLAIAVYATGYFAQDPAHKSGADPARAFWPLFLLASAALNALFLSGDLFNLYVTLELLTLAGVALIGLAGSVASLIAALRYLIVALVGSLFYLLGVVLTYSTYGTVDWELVRAAASPDIASRTALALFTIALMMKTALFPLHTWLPDAHSNAPAPVSALLSGVVLKASFYMALRIWFFAFPAVSSPAPAQLVGALAACAILWGSIQAVRQRRAKLMLAYSSVAQVGYLFMVFALMWGDSAHLAWQAAACLALSHACAKSAAFMSVGTIALSCGSDEIRRWKGIAARYPSAVLSFAVAGVSLMGLPPSGGFVGKWLLLNAAMTGQGIGLVAAVVGGSLLAAAYIFRVLAVAMTSGDSREAALVPAALKWPPLVLAILSILLGFIAAYPLSLLEHGAPLTGRSGP